MATPTSKVSSPSRREPELITHQQEQEELQGLNDGLANYIDRVRFLEAEKSRLSAEVQSTDVWKREATAELADAPCRLDETEASKYKAEYQDLLAKFEHRDRDVTAADQHVEALEAQVSELLAKLSDAEGSRKRLQKENSARNMALHADIANIEKQLATAKKQIEEETSLRMDLENRMESLKKDLHFKSQVFEQIADLKTQAERTNASAGSAWEELSVTRKHCDELTTEINRLKAENAGHPMRVNDLETQLAQERDEFRLRMTEKDEELADLRLILERQMEEYSDLLDEKARLDREIDAYHRRLESKETRLNISDSSQTSQTSQSSRSPGRSTPKRGAKRKRVDISETVQEFSERSASSGYARSASTKGGIDITEVDREGKFIKLTNTTSKNIAVGAWHLKHVAGEQETTFKFHHRLLVKAGSTVTVWSADSETPHKPPNDIVMKGKQWFVAEEMKTMLLNTDEEEMASCTMSKSSLRSVSTYSQHRLGPHDELDAGEVPHDERDAGEVPHDELDAGEGPDGENCAVM